MNITLQDLMNGVIYAGTLAGALAGIGVLLHFAVVRPVRKFLNSEITVHLVEIRTSLDDNGHELAQLREDHEHLATAFREHTADGHGPERNHLGTNAVPRTDGTQPVRTTGT
jgi:hypothetical protein